MPEAMFETLIVAVILILLWNRRLSLTLLIVVDFVLGASATVRQSADGSRVGHVPDGLCFDVRGPLSPGLARPSATGAPMVSGRGQSAVHRDGHLTEVRS